MPKMFNLRSEQAQKPNQTLLFLDRQPIAKRPWASMTSKLNDVIFEREL